MDFDMCCSSALCVPRNPDDVVVDRPYRPSQVLGYRLSIASIDESVFVYRCFW